MKLMIWLGLATGLNLVAINLVYASSTNFANEMRQAACAKQAKAHIDSKLQRQTWAPREVSVKSEHLHHGISFRDTRTEMAYEIWVDGKKTNYLASNLKTNQETLSTWDAKKQCAETETTRARAPMPLPTAKGFTDTDLQVLMKKNHWGLIYVWTPFMPLSVEALTEIHTAAKAKGGALTILYDGRAPKAEGEKWVEKKKASEEDLTPVASEELYSRSLGLHYPVVFIYKDGFLSNRDFEGFKPSSDYEKWIDLELADLKKDMQ